MRHGHLWMLHPMISLDLHLVEEWLVLELPSFEILASARVCDYLKRRSDRSSNWLPPSQLFKILSCHCPPGCSTFILVLFSLTFHFYFVSSLRDTHSSLPYPEKRVKAHRGDVPDPVMLQKHNLYFKHINVNINAKIFSKNCCVLKLAHTNCSECNRSFWRWASS